MFDCVLIANRGEIAVRVARALRDLGIRSVAVFSDADAGAAHVRACDEAVRIGPAPARASYLSTEAVLDAARRTGAQAIHPGYGFLSENAAFARACAQAGVTFIGPPPEAIELMGDKARAKALAREAGVPVIPGLAGDDVGDDAAQAFCAERGLPVMVKAVAGGGGKGMRVVRDAAQLTDALAAARREAGAAFGDERLLIERFIEAPRHIELQVLADRHGDVVHVGERECSLQRRHQKVIEEAPSPVLDPGLRARMGAAAVQLARACGYEGAGTVEFVVPRDSPESFFLLEMNTRLQVEHPVTELVFGVDLVAEQLRIAAGEPVSVAQDEIVPHGCAVEARLYAEDPAAGFLPQAGRVLAYREPAGVGLRIDSGVAAGDAVPTHYDPLLAKLIAAGPDRPTALRRLDRALARLDLLGLRTNVAFLRALLARDEVRAGTLDTGLIERIVGELAIDAPSDLRVAAALALFLEAHEAAGDGGLGWRAGGPAAPWRCRREHADRVVGYAISGTPAAAVVEWGGIGGDRLDAARAASDGADGDDGERSGSAAGAASDGASGDGPRRVQASVARAGDDALRVELDGHVRRYAIARAAAEAGERGALWIGCDGHALVTREARGTRAATAAASGTLEAPMPGKVLLVHAAQGDTVEEGQVLMVLESMKMELSIAAPRAGVVAELALAAGDQVTQGQALAVVRDEEDQ